MNPTNRRTANYDPETCMLCRRQKSDAQPHQLFHALPLTCIGSRDQNRLSLHPCARRAVPGRRPSVESDHQEQRQEGRERDDGQLDNPILPQEYNPRCVNVC